MNIRKNERLVRAPNTWVGLASFVASIFVGVETTGLVVGNWYIVVAVCFYVVWASLYEGLQLLLILNSRGSCMLLYCKYVHG